MKKCAKRLENLRTEIKHVMEVITSRMKMHAAQHASKDLTNNGNMLLTFLEPLCYWFVQDCFPEACKHSKYTF